MRRAALGILAAWTLALAGAPGGARAARAPADDYAHYEAAREAFARKAWREALEHLEKARALNPEEPLYVYNIGRVIEEQGRLSDAHATYTQALAFPGLSGELKAMVEAQSVRLRPLLAKAVVRFEGLDPGRVVQVDGSPVTDLQQDGVLEPGRHQICIGSPDGALVSCWSRDLAAGVRTSAPFPEPPHARGVLRWPKGRPVAGFSLDGHLLLVDLGRLEEIRIDAGRHEVVASGADGVLRRAAIDVLPGGVVPAPESLFGGSPTALGPGDVRGRTSTSGGGGPGPWPWILTGAGGVALAAGAGFLVAGAADLDDAERPSTFQKDAARLHDRGTFRTDLGVGLGAAGVAAVAGGIAWLLLSGDGEESTSWTLDPAAGTVSVVGPF